MPIIHPKGVAYMMAGEAYRYFEARCTKHLDVNAVCTLNTFDVVSGATNYPTQTMTANNAPAPLVASAIMTANAWQVFDDNNVTFWTGTTSDASGNFSPAQWIRIDLGAGNEIVANAVKLAMYNTGGADRTWVDFTVYGSNNATDWDLLLTITNNPSKPHETPVTYPF